MKIVALLPFKNEELLLPTYLSSVTQIADEIIAIDDGSTDNSRSILETAGVTVYSAQDQAVADWLEEKAVSGWAEYSIRQMLLYLGREQGGTHFVCLDADEALTANFIENAREWILKLSPGQKLSMQWLALWKSPYCYRDDASVWSNNYKDFIFCDDEKSGYDYAVFGVGRTPGSNSKKMLIKVPLQQGAVLHFQFASWQRFQLKQAFYRCSELTKYPASLAAINQKYAITLEDPQARTVSMPEEWLTGLQIPDGLAAAPALHQHLEEILMWFDQYGMEFFEPLQIWHVPELEQEFVTRIGRKPGQQQAVRPSEKMKIAFIKFSGLAAGGTERWLQMMAANLPRDEFEIDYYYCDSAPYIGSNYQHSRTDPYRQKYMQEHGVNLIQFRVGAKDVTKPTHDWIDTDFWQVFDQDKYDLVQTAKAGPPEYPYHVLKLPVVEYVTQGAGVDYSPNIACSIHLSQWQRTRWYKAGGNLAKSAVIPIPVEPPASKNNLRSCLGIPDTAIVAGFHQRADDNIFSSIPLAAFAQVQQPGRHFFIMGGGSLYRVQAEQLGLKNIHFLEHSGDAVKISEFLNTLDIFAHGRKDGETFGTVLAEAMMHGKPCLSHASPIANAQRETMGPAGLFAVSLEDYTTKLQALFTNEKLRLQLNGKARYHAEKYYSVNSCVQALRRIYHQISGRTASSTFAGKPLAYGQSRLGFLYAGAIEQPAEIAHHVAAGTIPEAFNVEIVRSFLPQVKVFFDIGSNTGLYCFLAANECPPGAEIYAFEPQRDCCDIMRETIYLNNWENRVAVHSIGIIHRSGQLLLHVAGSGSSFDNRFNDNAPVPTVTVPVETLDNTVERLAVKKVDFIKIDVEGLELHVLAGGEAVIKRDKPILFIEIADGIRGRQYRNPYYAQTLKWLAAHGYYIWRSEEEQGQLVQVQSIEPQEHLHMYLCLHQEAHAQWFT